MIGQRGFATMANCVIVDRVYQFILEACPSVAALVGVPDIPCTSFVFCNDTLYGTRLAAVSLGVRASKPCLHMCV